MISVNFKHMLHKVLTLHMHDDDDAFCRYTQSSLYFYSLKQKQKKTLLQPQEQKYGNYSLYKSYLFI